MPNDTQGKFIRIFLLLKTSENDENYDTIMAIYQHFTTFESKNKK